MSWLDNIGNFALNAAGDIYNPIADAINNSLQAQQEALKQNKGNPLKAAAQATAGLAKNTVLNPKLDADLASLAVPFGKGGNIATKAILPGMVSSGLGEAAQPNATPSSVTGAAVTGAAIPAVAEVTKGALSKLAPAAEQAGNKFIQSQYSVPPAMSHSIDIPGAVKKLADYGFTSLNDVANVAPKVTGSDGIITKLTRDAVSKANPVNLGDILDNNTGQKIGGSIYDTAQTLINQGDFIPESAAKKFNNTIEQGVKNISGSNIAKADPSATYQFIQGLEKKAAQYKGNQDIGVQQLRGAYQGMADELKDRLFNQAGADSMLTSQVLTPEVTQQLSEISPKLAQDATGVKTVGDLRSLAAPFVQGSKLAEATAQKTGNKTISLPQVLEVLSTMTSGNPAGVALALSQTNGGKNAIGRTLRNVGQTVGTAASQELPQIGKDVAGQAEARLPAMFANGNQSPQNNTNTNNPSHTTDSIPSNSKYVKSNDDGTISLAPLDSQTVVPGYMSTQDYQNQRTSLTRQLSDPSIMYVPQRVAAVNAQIDNLDKQYKTGQDAKDQILKNNQLTGGEQNFMRTAPTIAQGFNSVYQEAKSVPPNVLNTILNNPRAYVDPQYAGFAADIAALPSLYSEMVNIGALSKDQQKALLPQVGDSQSEVTAKIQKGMQYFASAYSSRYEPYTLVSAETPGVTTNNFSGATRQPVTPMTPMPQMQPASNKGWVQVAAPNPAMQLSNTPMPAMVGTTQ